MTDDKQCLQCGELITIPESWIGECAIHDKPHKRKDYCEDWNPLERRIAYCRRGCGFDGMDIAGRPADKVADFPESRPLSQWPPGSVLRSELDVSYAIQGAPIYFIIGWGDVVKLDPKTRSRTRVNLPPSVRMCAAAV